MGALDLRAEQAQARKDAIAKKKAAAAALAQPVAG
jgi:hypothetical protein